MNLDKELINYEIGGIGDIKKYTLRFHSYYLIARDGKVTIYAEYESGNPPKVFKGYPSGQELLLELCNLHLEVKDKLIEEAACIIIRWCTDNLHPYYFYNEERELIEDYGTGGEDMWDALVNMLSGYPVYIDNMLPDLEKLYTDTMTIFALRHLIEGNIVEAQRVYEGIQVPDEENLIRQWLATGKVGQQKLCEEIVGNLPKLSMELQYDRKTRQIQMEPVVNSVIDAAYFALSRFAAVNAGALNDYGGKTNIAFCQACGRAFIKRGNRQKYCGTMQCQSIRNNRKSSDYYYRKKKKRRLCSEIYPVGSVRTGCGGSHHPGRI